MAQPDSKKIFFENLSGAGKAIAVLTSGGDAQGKVSSYTFWGYRGCEASYQRGQARRGRGYTPVTAVSAEQRGFYLTLSSERRGGTAGKTVMLCGFNPVRTALKRRIQLTR